MNGAESKGTRPHGARSCHRTILGLGPRRLSIECWKRLLEALMRIFAVATALSLSIILVPIGLAATDTPNDRLGSIDFPNSGSPEAQEAFLRGVLLLHSFEFEDSLTAFEEAISLDPDFALAYWGAAMTHNHPLWAQQDRDAAVAVLARLAPTAKGRYATVPNERERDYLRALDVLYAAEGEKVDRDLAYRDHMEAMTESYPEDQEAAAFYSLSILGATRSRDFRSFMHAASVAEDIFAENPRHPGAAHYLIHSYDDPVHARLGLRAAREYAKIAPAASHAQHMISHIYTALGWWNEVIVANEKALLVSEERLVRLGQPLAKRSHHALHWLQYALLQVGADSEARAATETIIADLDAMDALMQQRHYAMMRATWISDDPTRNWVPEVRDLPLISSGLKAVDLFATGYRAASLGDLDAASAALAALRDLEANLGVGVQGSEKTTILALELDALIHWASGRRELAISVLSQAADLETRLDLEYGPPDISKPTHELLGDMLLVTGDLAAAELHFEESLSRAPRRAQSLRGLIEARARQDLESEARAALLILDESWDSERQPSSDGWLREVKAAL